MKNATNHSLSDEQPKCQLCDGTAPARGGRHCQADGQAHPQQVHHHLHSYLTIIILLFTNLFRYLWTCLVLDFLLVQLVIGPFTVAIWRGAWELYDDIFLVKKFLSSFWSKLWTDKQEPIKKTFSPRVCLARIAGLLV